MLHPLCNVYFSLHPLPNCASALCHTSALKTPQPDFFSNVAGANVVPIGQQQRTFSHIETTILLCASF